MLIAIFLFVNLSLALATPIKKFESPYENTGMCENCLSAFRSGALERHNQLRDKHGVPRLNLDSNLDNIAQAYSQKLAIIRKLIHSGAKGLGENLAMAISSVPFNQSPDNCYKIGQAASQDWYDEIKNYDFNKPEFGMNTGHFTQLVWKSSINVGFGIGFTDDGKSYYVVANYSPPGNVIGDFPNNVFPPRYSDIF